MTKCITITSEREDRLSTEFQNVGIRWDIRISFDIRRSTFDVRRSTFDVFSPSGKLQKNIIPLVGSSLTVDPFHSFVVQDHFERNPLDFLFVET